MAIRTINDELRDSVLRHAVDVRRFETSELSAIVDALSEVDEEIIDRLRASKAPLSLESARFRALLKKIRQRRADVLRELRSRLRKNLNEFSVIEFNAEASIIEGVIPVEIDLTRVPLAKVRAVVSNPFEGFTLHEWFGSAIAADARAITQQIRMGVLQGETIDQLARRLSGTRAMGYRDGVMTITRRNATMLVRTAVNHVSNAAREMVHTANADLVGALRWFSTLDGRTTAICQDRSGRLVLIGMTRAPEGALLLEPQTARPPAHIGCRSIMVPAIDSDGLALRLADRPFVRDTRTRRQREIDFRAEAKSRAGAAAWKRADRAERRRLINVRKREWTAANVGQVPADVTFQPWLADQPAAFQDMVLGKTKGRLFRQGGLTVHEFVDRRGNELTLAQLASREPDAFIQAGLNPDSF